MACEGTEIPRAVKGCQVTTRTPALNNHLHSIIVDFSHDSDPLEVFPRRFRPCFHLLRSTFFPPLSNHNRHFLPTVYIDGAHLRMTGARQRQWRRRSRNLTGQGCRKSHSRTCQASHTLLCDSPFRSTDMAIFIFGLFPALTGFVPSPTSSGH